MALHGHRNSEQSDSSNSNRSRLFYSARSSLQDADMHDASSEHLPAISATLKMMSTQSHDSILPETNKPSMSTQGHGPNNSSASDITNRVSIHDSINANASHQDLIDKSRILPRQIPLDIIKYGIGRRELAMQSQNSKPFDIVHREAYTHPPCHTPRTEQLKAWHTMVARYSKCLPRKHNEPPWPQIKVAFGPLGWDQVWGYEYMDSKKLVSNAGYKDWWLRASASHLTWSCLYDYVELYGAEVTFPYGYDAKVLTIEEGQKEELIKIPAECRVLVPLGKDILEWTHQVLLRNKHWEDGPPLMTPFNPWDRMQEPPTIIIRFKNVHPELPTRATSTDDKGAWRKGWLTTEEVTILSGEENSMYLDRVIDGGPKQIPHFTNRENQIRMLRFWDVAGKRDEVIKWMSTQNCLKERFWVQDDEFFREIVEDKVCESVARAIRDTLS